MGIYTRQATCLPIRAEEGLMGVLSPPNNKTPYCMLPPDQQIGGYPTQEQIEAFGVDPAILDAEGRCVILEFPAFVLFGIYSPANSNGLRDDFRYGFIQALDARIRNLDKMGKRVVLTGDLNVSRGELDTANAEEDLKKQGMTHDDYVSTPNRRIFNQLVHHGDVVDPRDDGREKPVLWDTCREMHPTRTGMFTHWEQKINARPANYGSRIDYVLCSLTMSEWVQEANIQEGLMGSDHCPVFAVLKDEVSVDGESVQLADILNPPGFVLGGNRVQDHALKHLPTTCARLFPEFDRRRTIRDMFAPKKKVSTADEAVATTTTTEAVISPSKLKASQQSVFDSAPPSSLGSQISATSPLKQKPVSGSSTPNGSLKRKRGAATETARPPPSLKGQQSLKGFFAPTATAIESEIPKQHDKPEANSNPHAKISAATPATTSASSLNGESLLSMDAIEIFTDKNATDASAPAEAEMERASP